MAKLSTKDPAGMSAAQINKELDRLDALNSKLTDRFIAAGRGHERAQETLAKDDPLALEYIAVWSRKADLRNEIELRMGPGAQRRLPRGFGPIKRNPIEQGRDEGGVMADERIPYREVLAEVNLGPGRHFKPLSAAAQKKPLTDTEKRVLATIPPEGLSLGFVSKPMVYGRPVRYLGKREHQALFNLLGKGAIELWRVHLDSPRGAPGFAHMTDYVLRRTVRENPAQEHKLPGVTFQVNGIPYGVDIAAAQAAVVGYAMRDGGAELRTLQHNVVIDSWIITARRQ